MGPEARLRGRLHRQGHRHRLPRPRHRHGQPVDRRTRDPREGRQRRRSSPRTLSDAERTRYLREYPNRVAVKHAHSQRNPEKDWGRYTLAAIDFAFYIINSLKDARAGTYTPGEHHRHRLERVERRLRRDRRRRAGHARADRRRRGVGAERLACRRAPLLDYTTLLNVYLPCASLAAQNAPLNTVPQPLREARCASLAQERPAQGRRRSPGRPPRARRSCSTTASCRRRPSRCPRITRCRCRRASRSRTRTATAASR